MPKLIIMAPDGAPQTFELEDSTTIGRSPDVPINIDDIACSRRHCQISRNGTKVNGVKRNRHVLSDGDVVEIGETRITYRDREGTEEEVILEDFGGGAAPETGDCYLVYSDGDRKGQRIPLAGNRVTFGRKDSNTVVLKDAMSSSYHCEITREGGGYVLRDLGSTNGTIVNGEAVSETQLAHGARLRIGKTRFVFLDPAVADFEQAIAAEEEQEAEWGLMRAQVDMARVKRARRASLVWLGIFVLVIGGGAAVFATQPDLVKGLLGMQETVTIREVAGNRIDLDDHSFENPGFPWTVPEDEPGEVRVGTGPAHQGTNSLALFGTEEGAGVAVARMGQDITVVSGQAYEISAWVKTASPGTLARAGVLWRSAGESSVERFSFTPFAADGDWNRVETVVKAPPRAELCRFVVAVLGAGSAHFDDIVLRKADKGARVGEEREKSGFKLFSSEDGVLSVERTGRVLLWNGGFTGVTPEGGLVVQSFAAEGGASGGYRLPGGGSVGGGLTLTADDEGFLVTISLEGAPEGLTDAGLGFVVSRSYLSEGATISGSWGSSEVQSDTDAADVEKVILGGSGNRLSIVAVDGARFRMFSVPEGLRFALTRPAAAGSMTFKLVLDFNSQRQEARAVLSDARGALGTGRLGDAIRLFGRIVNEFPFDEDLKRDATKERDRLIAAGEAELAKARLTFDAAKNFYDVNDLRSALAEAEACASKYSGYEPVVTEAGALTDEVQAVLVDADVGKAEALAERLELRAADFERSGQKRLARLFYSRIVELYPATEAAKRAQAKLQ